MPKRSTNPDRNRTIIFDIDGTLTDMWPLERAILSEMIGRECAKELDAEHNKGAGTAYAIFSAVSRRISKKRYVAQYNAAFHALLEANALPPLEEFPIVDWIRKKSKKKREPLFVYATGGQRGETRYVIDMLGLGKIFDVRNSFDKTRFPRSGRKPIREIKARFPNCMFVTDTMRDCEVARKAQVPVVRIEPGHKIEPGLFDNADVIPLPKNRFDEAVKLYRRVWRDTDVYAEVFSKDEAEREIRDFSDAWIVQDSGRCIIGLVGGMPLAKYIESLKTGAYDEHRRRTVHDMFGRTIGACYYIDTLAVRPDCQGEGLGSRLLDFFIHEMLKGGVSCFVLRTTLHPDNPAIKLYRKFGFEPLVDRESRMPVTQMVEQKRLPHHPKWDCRIWLQGNSHSLNLPPRTPL